MARIRRAQSLVEFALVLPMLVMIIMGVFDLGRAIYSDTVIGNAAREGARTGIIKTKTDADIISAVQSTAFAIGTTDPPMHISISPSPTRSSPGTINVTVTYTFTAITPLIGSFFGPSGNLILTGSTTMTVE